MAIMCESIESAHGLVFIDSGAQTWEFKHPNFRADTKKSLEFIKVRLSPGSDNDAPAKPSHSAKDRHQGRAAALLLRAMLRTRRRRRAPEPIRKSLKVSWRYSSNSPTLPRISTTWACI